MLKTLYLKRKIRNKIVQASLPFPNKKVTIHSNIGEMKKKLESTFGKTYDFMIEHIEVGHKIGIICYLTSMTNSNTIAEKLTVPLTNSINKEHNIRSEKDWYDLFHTVFPGTDHQIIEYENEVYEQLLDGKIILLLDGLSKALSIKVTTSNYRSIEEPSTQTIIRGPKDGFVEDIETNVSLIRRRIKNPSLRFEQFVIGSETRTTVYISYMEGIVNQSIVEEVRTRLSDINTNAIFESANIEDFITDKSLTPFPLLFNTERPDAISAHLLSGKIAIIVDGTPFTLTVPCVFTDFVTSPEDYYQPFMMGSLIRAVRYLAFFIALLLPAVYVGIITYHHEMIPTELLISLATQREGIPFPAVIEALLMEVTFEILREAGIRMPRAVGGTISIVGGLVIGQAAVDAGIVSNIMVIVVALTAISSFVSPVYSFAIATRLLRFIFILLSAVLGLYGVLLGLVLMVAHLASLRSFGVPYLAPVAPMIPHDQEDVLIRLPAWMMKKRPELLRTENSEKQSNAESPTPPPNGGRS
ncbi:spore germination protein [Bacillus sp. FJAT-45350]|uniref:spore germination protein n=1 Tax=Bacillus sp. FJAT-45350 TaxID=2011014 RepID=UPI000BB79237|nr:spore germination protein [Bacillus sp. FJAT-45350]